MPFDMILHYPVRSLAAMSLIMILSPQVRDWMSPSPLPLSDAATAMVYKTGTEGRERTRVVAQAMGTQIICDGKGGNIEHVAHKCSGSSGHELDARIESMTDEAVHMTIMGQRYRFPRVRTDSGYQS